MVLSVPKTLLIMAERRGGISTASNSMDCSFPCSAVVLLCSGFELFTCDDEFHDLRSAVADFESP